MNTTENETISDFETALDTWDIVTDANNLVWIRDVGECARFWRPGRWVDLDASHRPTPPFTETYADEGTASAEADTP